MGFRKVTAKDPGKEAIVAKMRRVHGLPLGGGRVTVVEYDKEDMTARANVIYPEGFKGVRQGMLRRDEEGRTVIDIDLEEVGRIAEQEKKIQHISMKESEFQTLCGKGTEGLVVLKGMPEENWIGPPICRDCVKMYNRTNDSRSVENMSAKKTSKTKVKAPKAAKPKGFKAAAQAEAVERVSKPKKTMQECLCGCGEMCARFFCQGHDSRLGGFYSRMAKGKATTDEIKRAKAAAKHDAVRNSAKFGPLLKAAGL